MIIDTELTDTYVNNVLTKKLIMSFLNDSGKVSFFTYDIPKEDLFKWKYLKPGYPQEPNILSWDKKPVMREYPNNGVINDQRIHEILLDLEKKNPSMEALHKLQVPDIAYCDIEVDVREDGFPDAESARNQVNTIAWVHNTDVIVFGLANLTREQIQDIQRRIDEHCKKFKDRYNFEYRYYHDETSMIMDFMFNYVKPMPCVTGWNFMGYDWMYLTNRCKLLDIDLTSLSPTGKWKKYSLLDMFNSGEKRKVSVPMHKLIFDYMEVYFKWDQAISPKESYKLDDVGEAAVGVKKVQHKLGFTEMWDQTPDDYVYYNAVDAILVREIDKKLNTKMALLSLANLMHCDCLTAFSPVMSLQIVQGEYMYRDGYVFPDEKREVTESREYQGAFVYDPIPGVYRNIIALDFASLYPTTLRQFNISPDTFITKDKNRKPHPNEIRCVSGAVYRKDVEGMLPKICTSFYNQRKAYKKDMKVAIQEMYDLKDIYEKRFGKLPE